VTANDPLSGSVFDFGEQIDRRNTGAMAKNGFREYLFDGQEPVALPCADDDAISMWVADMAFASAPAARQAMLDRIQGHPILGYSAVFGAEFYDPFARWCDDHYGWRPEPEHLRTSRGVVPALKDFAKIFLGPGEAVLTLTPAYGQFKNSADEYRRELVTCPLVEDSTGRYHLDIAAFEERISQPHVKMFFLCHRTTVERRRATGHDRRLHCQRRSDHLGRDSL